MYALALCGVCRRARVIDKSTKQSTCPYCNSTEKTSGMTVYFESNDQSECRDALAQIEGFEAPDDRTKKKRIENADPYSTMIYKYEHASDLDEKMLILAKGLTGIKGTFTLDDIREIVGDKHAEQYISAMLDRCYISEVKIGHYKG